MDGFWRMDLQGRLLEVNEAYCRMSGYTAAELLRMRAKDLDADKQAAEIAAHIQFIMQRGSHRFEARHRRKDGSPMEVEISVQYRPADGGHLVLFIRDVAERKRAARDLAKSETRFRQLFSEMTMGFALHEIICDAAGRPCDYRFLEINPAFEQLTGLRREDLVGRTVLEAMPQIELHWIETYGRVALTGTSIHFENFSQALGKHFDVVAYRPAPGQFAVLFSDITGRKQAAAELERLNRLYAALSQVNQTIVQVGTRADLFQELANVIVKFGGFKMAWVGLIDPASQQVLPVSQAGTPADYLQQVRIMAADVPEGRGPTGKAIREKHPYVCNDLMNDLISLPWREAVARAGFRAAAAFPIQENGQVCGALTVYSEEVGFFGTKEEALLTEAALDISYALNRLRDQELRRQAEAALLRSEAMLVQAQDIGKVGGWEWNLEQQTMFWTAQTYRIHGFDPNEIPPNPQAYIARSIECYPEEERSRVLAAFHQCVQQGLPYEMECRFINTQGRPMWIRTAGRAIHEDGRIVKVIGDIQDITERKQAEIARQEGERRLQMALTAAHMGVWEFDFSTGKLYWSPELFTNLGVPPMEPSRELMMQMTHPEDAGLAQRAMDAALQTHGHYHCVYRVLVGDRIIWVEDRAQIVRDAHDRPLKAIGTALDITERKQAEMALRESEERLRLFIEHAPVAMAMFDRDMKYLAVSRRWTSDYGLTGRTIVGHSHYEIFPEIPERWKALHQRGLAGETMTSSEDPFERLDGSVQWLHWEIHPWRHADGSVGGIVIFSEDITRRKLTENSLRQSEERFATTFRASPVAIAITRMSNGVFIDVNEAACKLYGYPREELIGHSTLELQLIEPHERRRIVDALQKDGAFHGQSLTIFARGNQPREVLFSADIIELHGEQCMLNMSIDVSDRKAAERALALERDRAAQYLNIAEVMLVAFDDQARITLINRKGYEVLGYAVGELIGKDWFRVCLPPDEYEAVFGVYRSMMAGESRPFEYYENHVLTKGGQKRFIAWHNTVVKDANGRIIGSLNSGEDITERKRLEEEHSRLAAAIEQAAETIVITDLQGTILYANPAFERSSGYARAEALGQNPRLLKSGRQDAAFYQQLWATLLRGENWHGFFTNKRKDGTLYEEEATISPVRDPAGTVTNYVAIKLDVTRERQLQGQLLQAQKMESVGRLAGGVAHDFNNILQTILGYSETLLEQVPSTDAKHADLQEIQKSALRAAGLTGQLLAFSRKQMIRLVPLDLNDVVTDTQKMLHRLLGEDIRTEISLGSQLPPVQADAGQIQQVLVNLAVNARDAMPHGGRLSITTDLIELDEQDADIMVDARAGRFVRLAISDTGVGMSAEVMARIFEPFFSTKGLGKGTGLGLSVIYGIIQQHKGWITVYSRPHQGSTFNVYLPTCSAATTVPVSASTATLPSRGRGERILLIEDEPEVRSLAIRVLTVAGYEVQPAGTAAEGLALFARENGRFDLVFSDVVLPDQNGILTVEELLQKKPDLGVLLCSGYTDERSRWHTIEEKKFRFLQKPYPATELLRAVQAVLAARPTPPA